MTIMDDQKPLVEDLADVLVHMVVGWEDRLGFDLAKHPEIVRVMARYHQYRQEYLSEERVLSLVGVHLPTGGAWVDLPGTDLQVCAYAHDLAGSFRLRKKPATEEDR